MMDGLISVNGQDIYYRDYPNEDTETVIFLHYGSGNLSMWNAMLPSFVDDFRVITCDLRGHGCSSKPARGYHIDELADDVSGLMERLSISKAYIVGSSLGMDTAVSLAARYPKKVIAIMGEGGFTNEFGLFGKLDDPQEFDERKYKIRDRRAKFVPPIYSSVETRIEATRLYFQQHDWEFNEPVIESIRYSTTELTEGKFVDTFANFALDEILEMYFELKLEDYHEVIKCPVAFFPDMDDLSNPRVRNSVAEFQKMLPYCKVIEVSGAVHPMLSFARPEFFTQEIMKFIEETKEIVVS